MYKHIDSITDTYKIYNEDSFGVLNQCFWVLDGALSLNKSKNTDGNTDVDWMVNWWQRYLTQNLNQFEKSIIKILEEGMDELNLEFSQFVSINQLSKLDRASAGIAILRHNKDLIECFVLGDVEINIRKKNDEILTLVDDKIEELDSKVMDMIYNNPNRDKEIVLNDYTQEELDVLREHRLMMNDPKGYYILEHDKNAIKNGIYDEFLIEDVRDILIMSDGFSAIYNKYSHISLKSLFKKCKAEGVKSVLRLIREIEDSDLELKTYKRLRKHDDATAIYIGS